ncbi:MAG: SDR family oxidoreductase [Pseudomonadota bacterium]|nr:SDR family oxidoreductase [Pseudomonadota bacterium]
MQLRDKTVLLTGAGGGIGRQVAAQLLARGARVLATGSRLAPLQQLQAELGQTGSQLQILELDLGAENLAQRVEELQQAYPQIDVVIHCAGVSHFVPCDKPVLGQLMHTLTINLNAMVTLTTLLLPALKQRPEAAVVGVGSTFGSIGYPGFAVYSASKFGARGYLEALRRELADTSVKVFYVSPRATRTGMNNGAVEAMNQALGNRMDDPQWVAQQLVKALETDRFKLFLGWPERLFVVINGLFSSLVDRALGKQLPVIRQFLKS